MDEIAATMLRAGTAMSQGFASAVRLGPTPEPGEQPRAVESEATAEATLRLDGDMLNMAPLEGVVTLTVFDGDELFLYRDRSRFRCLFFQLREPSTRGFATDLDGLVRTSWVALQPSRQALYEYLRFLDIAALNGWYEGVRVVEAGQLVRSTDSGMQYPPIDVALATAATGSMQFDHGVPLRDDHPRGGVAACLNGAEHPASFLRGRVDSTLLPAIGTQWRPTLLKMTNSYSR